MDLQFSVFQAGRGRELCFKLAETGNTGKIVEILSDGKENRPVDISITKNTLAIIISSFILIFLILYTARKYKRPLVVPKFTGLMEMFNGYY